MSLTTQQFITHPACWKKKLHATIHTLLIHFFIIQFLKHGYLIIMTVKSKVNVMIAIKDQRHIVYTAYCRCISLWFHVNRTTHSWDTTIANFGIPRPRPWSSWMLMEAVNARSHIQALRNLFLLFAGGKVVGHNWKFVYKCTYTGGQYLIY